MNFISTEFSSRLRLSDFALAALALRARLGKLLQTVIGLIIVAVVAVIVGHSVRLCAVSFAS